MVKGNIILIKVKGYLQPVFCQVGCYGKVFPAFCKLINDVHVAAKYPWMEEQGAFAFRPSFLQLFPFHILDNKSMPVPGILWQDWTTLQSFVLNPFCPWKRLTRTKPNSSSTSYRYLFSDRKGLLNPCSFIPSFSKAATDSFISSLKNL